MFLFPSYNILAMQSPESPLKLRLVRTSFDASFVIDHTPWNSSAAGRNGWYL